MKAIIIVPEDMVKIRRGPYYLKAREQGQVQARLWEH